MTQAWPAPYMYRLQRSRGGLRLAAEEHVVYQSSDLIGQRRYKLTGTRRNIEL